MPVLYHRFRFESTRTCTVAPRPWYRPCLLTITHCARCDFEHLCDLFDREKFYSFHNHGVCVKGRYDGSREMPEGKTGKDRNKAIRETCLICAGDRAERRNCPFTDCSLWEFRSGSPATRPIEGSGAKTQAHPYLTPPEGDVSPKPPYRLTFGDEEGQA